MQGKPTAEQCMQVRGCSQDTTGLVGGDSVCAFLEAALLPHGADEASMVHLEFYSSRN